MILLPPRTSSHRRLALIWLQKAAKTAMARGTGCIAEAWRYNGRTGRVEVLTHCNAARLVTARGISPASREGLLALFPERARGVPGE